MHVGRFRLGMRTFKTALSVVLCVLLFHVLGRDNPLIATITAVVSLRQDMTSTVSIGKERILGNTVGSIAAMIYLLVQHFLPQTLFLQLILLPVLVALVIIFLDGIDNNSGIITGIATFILITLSAPQGESVIVALDRIVDTFIGVGVAIFLNTILRPPEIEKEKEIESDLTELKGKEQDLQETLAKVHEKIKDKEKDEK
ncbi:FUSC family protein [Tetragenococcus koreensis]|uniref:FUSC family protein n=1 Tax=Tetragenococcus koreensis TaxID=290335 RepID=UPI001F204F56|nr:FUSC family protein [Tetragenococcus koreensis]MCF1584507.1 FUSC family protein [Tetragenococcus koreensis]MCF1614056.1 FUSC family protein [Tetragenococcus koreensis]MCF1616566.1 FUSC family protein [Tetragenococcus koreensis]MCF1620517.1 FUSC family protein [Tetragenococcus koreensis]MCF1621530.1 FUSC family protein [Tetragenococcus koreensis]